jgi:arabinosaccharide transport system substrate-binding protein
MMDTPREQSLVPSRSARAVRPARWLGPALIAGIAAVTALVAFVIPSPHRENVTMWTFARMHADMYRPALAEWNARQPSAATRVDLSLIGVQAMEQRVMSAFLAGLPSADLIEAERRNAARAFAGPIESVGFLDLTPYVERDGLLARVNEASFRPWTKDGRIFGLPHDVHPMMLAYRADIVEAAGINVDDIKTWDDFVRLMTPLLYREDGSRRDDRHALNLWETQIDLIEALFLQAGGGVIDASGLPVIDSEINARTIAHIALWTSGKNRIAAEVSFWDATGHNLMRDGYVIATFAPDWMCNYWRKEVPQLAGKMKLMPLPAWEEGGRRTSVWGGTMLGIPKTAQEPEKLWEIAKHLYLSRELAHKLYEEGDIITPVREFWSDGIFDRPDPFFMGQAKGRMYINLAPQVPDRFSSPFGAIALARAQSAVSQLCAHARGIDATTVEQLIPRARELLADAQRDAMRHVQRNVFFADASARGTAEVTR